MPIPVGRGAGDCGDCAVLRLLIGLPILPAACRAHGLALFDASIEPARWCSAAATSCCLCWQAAVVPPGWVSDELSSPVMARRKPCPDRCSLSRRISGVVTDLASTRRGRRCAWADRHVPPGILFWSRARCRSGTTLRRERAGAQRRMRGVNAAVVGLLGAAFTSALDDSVIASRRFRVGLVGLRSAGRVADAAAAWSSLSARSAAWRWRSMPFGNERRAAR